MSSAWGKRMSSAWGKRMSSAWGKRAESDNDEYYNQLLRELYHQAHFNKNDYPRFDNDCKKNYFHNIKNKKLLFYCLVFGQYLAQRTISNNDDEIAPQHMS